MQPSNAANTTRLNEICIQILLFKLSPGARRAPLEGAPLLPFSEQ
jgi:hypothetical protein